MKKYIRVLTLCISAGLCANVYGALYPAAGESSLAKAEKAFSVPSETAPLQIAHRHHPPRVVVPPPPRVLIPPPPRVVIPPPPRVMVPPPPRVVVVPPPPVVVAPPPRVVIPNYGYAWWNNVYVPTYNNWYWYNGGWVWGGRGPRPIPPRWVPDLKRRPIPPPPPRHHRPAPPRRHHRYR